MQFPAKALPRFCLFGLLGLIFAGLTFRLSSFPGLNGDEAWVGLRALDIRRTGFSSVHGMHTYTGALFPQIVAAAFSVLGAGTFSLRLPGAILNWLAVVVLAAAFRKRGHAAILAALLFASSLLFLFYSRVAWEVSALTNVLLALIVAALARLLPADRARFAPASLLFLAFALGTWNHFIFLAAAASFAVAAALVALTSPGRQSARLFLLGVFNLPLQAVLLFGKPYIADGPALTHALPTLAGGLLLVFANSILYLRSEARALPWIMEFPAHWPRLAGWMRNALVLCVVIGLLWALPFDGVSFFGMVSGFVVMERVVSHVPSPAETAGLYVRMAVLIAAFAVLALRQFRPGGGDTLKSIMLLWAVLFIPILRIETLQIPDRYFFIPQFLFFAALALAAEDLPPRWRQGLWTVLALGLVQTQFLLWRELGRADNRPPLHFFYGSYEDYSRTFLKLDGLHAYLRDDGVCHVESSSYFIYEPMRFLLAAGPPCESAKTARIEYCGDCKTPVARFDIEPQKTISARPR